MHTMSFEFPKLRLAEKLEAGRKVLLICAYGFEERSLAWTNFQLKCDAKIASAFVINYDNPKGKNQIRELKKNLKKMGVSKIHEVSYDGAGTDNIELRIENEIKSIFDTYDEIVLDITPLTKFLILLLLSKLETFTGSLRIIYTEAIDYAPSLEEYDKVQEKFRKSIKFPSRGFGTILRAKCLSSIRMQGQPVTLIAFTSFNEQLVRHMLGTLSPHRLLFINGSPPRKEFKWREKATGSLHRKLVKEYPIGNDVNKYGFMKRTASTLFYEETISRIDEIYLEVGLYERIIVAATGSKMQTVGLFFAKKKYPDIHVEYPTPDSYYIKGFSKGIREIHELRIKNFSKFINSICSV